MFRVAWHHGYLGPWLFLVSIRTAERKKLRALPDVVPCMPLYSDFETDSGTVSNRFSTWGSTNFCLLGGLYLEAAAMGCRRCFFSGPFPVGTRGLTRRVTGGMQITAPVMTYIDALNASLLEWERNMSKAAKKRRGKRGEGRRVEIGEGEERDGKRGVGGCTRLRCAAMEQQSAATAWNNNRLSPPGTKPGFMER